MLRFWLWGEGRGTTGCQLLPVRASLAAPSPVALEPAPVPQAASCTDLLAITLPWAHLATQLPAFVTGSARGLWHWQPPPAWRADDVGAPSASQPGLSCWRLVFVGGVGPVCFLSLTLAPEALGDSSRRAMLGRGGGGGGEIKNMQMSR